MDLPANVRRHSAGKFRAVVTVGGRRHVGPLRDSPDLAARDVAVLREGSAGSASVTTMRTAERLLYADLDARGSSPATVDYYRAHFRILMKSWGGDVPVSSITPEEVERYARKRKLDGVADSTIWTKELQVLDRICRLLIHRGEIAVSPVARARRPKIRKARFGVLTAGRVAECVAIIERSSARAGKRYGAVVALLFLTGLRRAELCRLRVADIDLAAGRIFVRGKTGDRYVPLGDEARAACITLIGKREPTQNLVGGVRSVETMFARVQAVTGEPLLTPHVLRHSHATAAVHAGVPAFTLAAILGHSDTRQTARYYHIGGAEARAAVDAVSLRHLRASGDRGGSAEPPAPDES